MTEEKLQIAVTDKQAVTAVVTPSEGKAAGWAFVYAPGAGANIHD